MTKLEHALRLASLGFWVFPITPGKKAPPAIKDWQEQATRNPMTLTATWASNPDYNIGISTSKFGDDEALLVVDIDTKNGKDGNATILKLELEGFDLPESYSQRTANAGQHLVYRTRHPVKQGANVLGPGVDVRSRGGYIVGAGSVVGDGNYSAEVREVALAPDWLIERCGAVRSNTEVRSRNESPTRVDQSRAIDRAFHYLKNEAPLAVEGEGGDETTFKVACRLKDFGINESQAALAMQAVWNERCSPPWSWDELVTKCKNAYAYSQNPPGVAAPEAEFTPVAPPAEAPEKKNPIDELNDHYALVMAGGGAHILWETTTHEGRYRLEHLTVGAFNTKYANRKMMVGKKETPLSNIWLEWKGRREYDGIVFMPGEKAPEKFFNLWKGFAYEPAERYEQHPAVEQFLEHARSNVCRGDDTLFRWLIGYFAHLVQRPWEKPLVALVFRGGKGVGKNALIERVGALLGGHFLLASNRRYLIGNFNGHLENCLMFALDEAFWSGDKQAEGTIKDLITGKNHVIEHKGKEPYSVANKTRVVIIGNEDWLVPASHDERRFAVFDVGDGRKQDRRFFTAMRTGMESGGYGQLLRFLLDYDIKDIDLNEAPSTKALMDQKHHSLDPLHQWWLDCLEEGRIIGAEFTGWPAEIECERFRAAFRRHVKERNIRSRIPEDRAIGRLMKQCAPGVVKRRLSKQEDGSQPYAYHLPPVAEARAEWCAFIGHAQEWQE